MRAPRSRIKLSVVVLALVATACATGESASPNGSASRPDDGMPPSPRVSPSPTPVPSLPGESPSGGGLLTLGDKGDEVKEVQSLLRSIGYDITVDGVYDDQTKESVISFEMEVGLPGDGAFGPEERRALEEAVAEHRQEDRDEKPRDEADERRLLDSGDKGEDVRALQEDLEELGYWVGPHDGIYGPLTEQAVLALQGVEGLTRDGIVGPQTRAALKNATPPKPRKPKGDHIEIDEARGVILVVRNGKTSWTFHTSTGTEDHYLHPNGNVYLADTPNGEWTFTWQVDGWRDGRLGRMWRPKYFHHDGIAIHGYPTVPADPASHGCARVTIAAMDFIWSNDLAPPGSTVFVYGRS